MGFGDGHVYRVHLVDPGGRITVQEVPTEAFEAAERGITLNGHDDRPVASRRPLRP